MVTGIYIHIPFCSRNCGYCHFVTVPLNRAISGKYLAGVQKEIALYANRAEKKIEVDSIYIGGGTPSLLPGENIKPILDACRHHFVVCKDCEISLEANPETISDAKAKHYKDAGVNRISLGVQSFHRGELEVLGRLHTIDAVFESVRILQENGFGNINLDLLLGIPLQTPDSWRENLRRIPETGFSHVSVYMLDLDEPCRLATAVAEGAVRIAGDDTIADLYLETIDILASYGYLQYEISNFAATDRTCKHNLKYWTREPVLGFGLASHSFDGHARFANYRNMQAYMQSLDRSQLPVQWRKPLGKKESLAENLFLGLRLTQGVQWNRLRRNYPEEDIKTFEISLRELGNAGYVEWEGSTVRLTPNGMLLSNEIFQQFV